MNLLRELMELCEAQDSTSKAEAIRTKLSDAQSDLKKLKAQLLSNPHVQPRVKRAEATIKDLQHELESLQRETPTRPSGEALAQHALKKRAEMSPDERRERHAEHIEGGVKNMADLTAKYGSRAAVLAAVRKFVSSDTQRGKYPISVSKVAKQFGIPERTMYKWFEEPALQPVRKWMSAAGQRQFSHGSK